MTWKPHCGCLFVHGLLPEYSGQRGFYMTIRMVLSNKKHKKNMHCSASCDVSMRMPLIPPQCSPQTHKHTCAHTHTHLRNYCPIIPIPHTPRGSNDKGANTNLLTQGCYYQPVTQMLCKLMFPLLCRNRQRFKVYKRHNWPASVCYLRRFWWD